LLLIQPDMAQVDLVIASRLNTGVPLVGQVCQYIISAGGKRLRPALLLMMAGALGYDAPQRFELAAVVEFIHTATLLHDDVVDESTLRRGRDTANQLFGNAASVLVGDFLYSRAFQMMVEVNQMRVMEVLAEATNVIAEGEVMQLMNTRNAELTHEEYLQVIRSKTAKLFEASARLPAIVAGMSIEVEQACADYGQALGTAFQIIDDALDYDGDVQVLGKNLGDDLREGKVTLPMIFAMSRVTPEQKQVLVEAIETGGKVDLSVVLSLIHESSALELTREAAWAEAQRAIDALQCLPDTAYKTALLQLADSLQHRRH
jgi:octaprenyl-diphosphate synthase